MRVRLITRQEGADLGPVDLVTRQVGVSPAARVGLVADRPTRARAGAVVTTLAEMITTSLPAHRLRHQTLATGEII